jgi:hypothetical protein
VLIAIVTSKFASCVENGIAELARKGRWHFDVFSTEVKRISLFLVDF